MQAVGIETPSIAPIILQNIYTKQLQGSRQKPNTSNKQTVERSMTKLIMPTRCILAGDFNSHRALWDSKVRSPECHKVRMDIIESNSHTLMNKPDTYSYNYPTGRGSSVVDLAVSSTPTIGLITNWALMEDRATESDHKVVGFELTSGCMESVPQPSTER